MEDLIIKETTGIAREFAPLGVELHRGRWIGSKYFPVPASKFITSDEFHQKYGPIEDAIPRLEKDAELLGQRNYDGEILLCPHSDPYQQPNIKGKNITSDAIEILKKNGLRFTVLTKVGVEASRDFDKIAGYEKARFGTTINFFSDADIVENEPEAARLSSRFRAIKMARKKGIRTWLNIAPVKHPKQALAFIKTHYDKVDYWKIGKINYYPEIVADDVWVKFIEDAKVFLDSKGANHDLKESLTELDALPGDIEMYKAKMIQVPSEKAVKSETAWTEGDIPTRKGNCNVLVIAPHGHKEDDENTYELVMSLADKLDCYAIVNKLYRKPPYKRGKDRKFLRDNMGKKIRHEPNKEKKWVNLNLVDHVLKHLQVEFLEPLEQAAKQIVDSHGNALIFWIHGLDDNSSGTEQELMQLTDAVDVLLGYGQGKPPKHTLKVSTIEEIEKFLSQEELGVHRSRVGSKYCGYWGNNMNQWFKKKKRSLREVESIQLEIKFTGFRDAPNIDKTTVVLERSIRALSQFKQLLPQRVVNDQELAEQAYFRLKDIFNRHYENALLEAGEYIFNTFYDGKVQAVKDQSPVKDQSLNKLRKRLSQSDDGAPSRSWLNYAVRLHVDSLELATVQTFGQLTASHKIQITRLDETKDKIRFANETVENSYSVRQLKEAIDRFLKKAKPEMPFQLTYLISRPEQLFGNSYAQIADEKSLSNLRLTTIHRLQTQADGKIAEIEKNIETQKSYVEGYRQLRKTLEQVEKQKQQKPNSVQSAVVSLKAGDIKSSPNGKAQLTYEGRTGIAETNGFQKKQLADFACNIGNVCEFGCTFCYVPSVTTKQKYVQDALSRYNIDEISLYRTKENLLKCVERDLKKFTPGDTRTVFFCTTCDPCATEEHADITTSALKMIMESSDLKARVLSKSKLLKEIGANLRDYKNRICYGLSTGTIRPEVGKCIEENATPLLERIDVLKWLQNEGFRTFGMLCPILPSEIGHLDKLIGAVNPSVCEGVWAEPINVRGKSLVKTCQKLKDHGLNEDADALQAIMGNKESWRKYCKELFLELKEKMKQRNVSEKLKFLQYEEKNAPDFNQFFKSQPEAVCLW